MKFTLYGLMLPAALAASASGCASMGPYSSGDARFGGRENLGLIAHVHIADHPGRAEPGTGALDFPAFFRLLDDLGYAGWVGCEYKPLGTTNEGLGWLQRLPASGGVPIEK